MERQKILEVKNLKKYFPIQKSVIRQVYKNVKAVDDVSFSIYKGETFSLVGESGCGKSTTGRTVIGLLKATQGQVLYNGKNIANLNNKEQRKITSELQMIFQDPYSSLDPRMTVGEIIEEPLLVHKVCKNKKERMEKAMDMLKKVGLREDQYFRYPHEFSGGQKQRIGIARALILNPKLIVCDEPVSALDVSIQSQVLNLLNEMKNELDMTYLFISHNMSVVRYISDRIGVMYLGHLVEVAPTEELFNNPLHPYTKALLSAVPEINPHIKKNRIILEGDIPSPINPPSGCVFHDRCPECKKVCSEFQSHLQLVSPQHWVACIDHQTNKNKVG